MRTTSTGKTYLEQFMGEVKRWVSMYNIPSMYLGNSDEQDILFMRKIYYPGNIQALAEATGTQTYALHNRKLGYESFKLITKDNGRDLLAVHASGVTPSLLNMVNMLGMYNGVRVRSVIKATGEADTYLFVFD